MLYFQRDWSREFAGEGDPVHSARQLGVASQQHVAPVAEWVRVAWAGWVWLH